MNLERRHLLDLLVHGVRLRRLSERLDAAAQELGAASERGSVARLAGALDATRARLRMDMFATLPAGTATSAYTLVAGPWELALAGPGLGDIHGPRIDLAGHVAERLGRSLPCAPLARILGENDQELEGQPMAGLLLEQDGHQALLLVEDLPRRIEVVVAPLDRLLESHPLVRGVAVDPGGALLPLLGVDALIAVVAANGDRST